MIAGFFFLLDKSRANFVLTSKSQFDSWFPFVKSVYLFGENRSNYIGDTYTSRMDNLTVSIHLPVLFFVLI